MLHIRNKQRKKKKKCYYSQTKYNERTRNKRIIIRNHRYRTLPHSRCACVAEKRRRMQCETRYTYNWGEMIWMKRRHIFSRRTHTHNHRQTLPCLCGTAYSATVMRVYTSTHLRTLYICNCIRKKNLDIILNVMLGRCSCWAKWFVLKKRRDARVKSNKRKRSLWRATMNETSRKKIERNRSTN